MFESTDMVSLSLEYLDNTASSIREQLHGSFQQYMPAYACLDPEEQHRHISHLFASLYQSIEQHDAIYLFNAIRDFYDQLDLTRASLCCPVSILLQFSLFATFKNTLHDTSYAPLDAWQTIETILAKTGERETAYSSNNVQYTAIKQAEMPDERTKLVTQLAECQRKLHTYKALEQDLRTSTRMYQGLFEKNPAIKLLIDPQNGRIVDANPAACDFYGYPLETLLTKTIRDINTHTPEEIAQAMQQAVNEEQCYFQFRHRLSSGEIREVEIYTGPFQIDQQTLLFSIVHDITERKRMEEELRESETRYRAIVEDQTDLICRFRPDGSITFVNDAYCRYFGKTREELVNPALPQLIPWEVDNQHYLTIFNEKTPVATSEHRVVAPDGEVRWQQWTDRVIFDEQGKIVEFQSVGRDITDQKHAERALQMQRDLAFTLSFTSDLIEVLSRVLDVILQIEGIDCGGVYVVDPHTGDLNLVIYHGLTEEFVAQVSFYAADSTHARIARQHKPVYGRYEDLFPAQPANKIEELRALAIIPLTYENQEVAVLNVASHGYDIIPSQSRSMLEVIGTQVGGVIARVKAETALRESQNNFQRLFDTLDDCLFIFNANGHILHFNPVVEHRLEYNAEELRGMRFTDIHPPEQQHEIEHVLAHIEPGETAVFTIPLKTRNGQHISVETRVTQGSWNNREVLFGISRDITELKRAEESLRHANEQLKFSVNWLEQRNREITLMNEMGDHLQSCISMKDAYTVIAQYALQLFFGNPGALYMLSESHNLVEMVTGWGEPSIEEHVFATDDCWCLRRGRTHLVENTENALHCHHMQNTTSLAYICVPLIAQGETIGMLHIRNQQALSGQSSARWVQLTTTVAEHIALALANLSLRERLHYQSIHDGLTGLFNRRYLEETLEREIHKAVRQQNTLGVIMLDIDHFKQFNDIYGHKAGDTMLQAVSTFLQTHIRSADVACRYGGEEFTIILPDATLEDTQKRAEQLARGVKNLQVEYGGKILGIVTLSLGVACYPTHGKRGEEVIRVADSALYRAKAEGRDRVVVADTSDRILAAS
jgi:diguanylate cyclase (GGDEF)-like protein/PAS domain S-box-containing protein